MAHGELAEVRETRDFKRFGEEVVDAGEWLKLGVERAGWSGLGWVVWRRGLSGGGVGTDGSGVGSRRARAATIGCDSVNMCTIQTNVNR